MFVLNNRYLTEPKEIVISQKCKLKMQGKIENRKLFEQAKEDSLELMLLKKFLKEQSIKQQKQQEILLEVEFQIKSLHQEIK